MDFWHWEQPTHVFTQRYTKNDNEDEAKSEYERGVSSDWQVHFIVNRKI